MHLVRRECGAPPTRFTASLRPLHNRCIPSATLHVHLLSSEACEECNVGPSASKMQRDGRSESDTPHASLLSRCKKDATGPTFQVHRRKRSPVPFGETCSGALETLRRTVGASEMLIRTVGQWGETDTAGAEPTFLLNNKRIEYTYNKN